MMRASDSVLERRDRAFLARVAGALLRKAPPEKAALLYDLDLLESRLAHLKCVFPASSLHAVAIKTQPMREVLQAIVGAGHALEAASFEEIECAARAGCPPERIVFDSPVKTRREIQRCCDEFPGLTLNVNALDELERIPADAPLRVGIRVNPGIVTGAPSVYDVSSADSKFGVPLSERAAIVTAALGHAAVRGLHVHVGSEIGEHGPIVEGACALLDIAEEVRARGKALDFIDIGGGIAARQEPGVQPGLGALYGEIAGRFPGVDRYQIVTEYGRLVHAHCGFALSRVEYVRPNQMPPAILTHLGADLFVREIYSDHPPFHDMFLLDQNGRPKRAAVREHQVGGPLCFAGDRFAGLVALAEPAEGDWLVIADAVANSIGMWSRHCSRTPPLWVTFRNGAADVELCPRQLHLESW